MPFCVWFLSLRTVFSKFILLVAGISISFLVMLNNIPLFDIPHFVLLFNSDGFLCCFYFLAIMNSATMHIHVCDILHVDICFTSLRPTPKSGIAGSCGNSVFNIFRNAAAQFYILRSNVWWFQFFLIICITFVFSDRVSTGSNLSHIIPGLFKSPHYLLFCPQSFIYFNSSHNTISISFILNNTKQISLSYTTKVWAVTYHWKTNCWWLVLKIPEDL